MANIKLSVQDERSLVMGLSETLKDASVHHYGVDLFNISEEFIDKELRLKYGKVLDK